MKLEDLVSNYPLHQLCTLGIGGPARYFFIAKTISDFKEIFQLIREEKCPFFILGKGSNCLFRDEGYNGIVILNKLDSFKRDPSGKVLVGSGYSFSLLGVKTAKEGWSGLEFASGIPGTVGGAVFMNAGANGCETSQCLTQVEFMDMEGNLKIHTKSELNFSYRKSPFQGMQGAIISAEFQLTPNDAARQSQLKIVDYRLRTQPYKEKSAGCVFKNPEGTAAGYLIDKAGLKGFSIGGASVSDLHGNFLLNANNATEKDFKDLIAHIQEKIKNQFGIELETEIRKDI